MVWLLGPLKPTFFLHFVLVSSESQRKSSAVVIKSKDKPGTAFSFIEQLQFNARFKLCECILLYATVWICLFFVSRPAEEEEATLHAAHQHLHGPSAQRGSAAGLHHSGLSQTQQGWEREVALLERSLFSAICFLFFCVHDLRKKNNRIFVGSWVKINLSFIKENICYLTPELHMSETDVEILLPKLFLSHSVSYMKKKCHEIIFFLLQLYFLAWNRIKDKHISWGRKKVFCRIIFFADRS